MLLPPRTGGSDARAGLLCGPRAAGSVCGQRVRRTAGSGGARWGCCAGRGLWDDGGQRLWCVWRLRGSRERAEEMEGERETEGEEEEEEEELWACREAKTGAPGAVPQPWQLLRLVGASSS